MPHKSIEQWQAFAASLSIPTQAYINGQFVDALSGDTFKSINPATGQLIAEVASCDLSDVDLAVDAARNSFDQGVWAHKSPAERKQTLSRLAQLILDNKEQLALLESLDMGKPVRDSFQVDIPGAARCVQWTAEAIDKVYDEIAPTPHNSIGLIQREPLGVVAAIVPWNFPLLMACWKIAPALAMGNSVILKPSEKSPFTALYLAKLAGEAGIPDGVFNVLPGFGHTAGKALGLHKDVDCMAFTGSTAVGKMLIQYAGQSNMKRTFMECGGKSPNVVFADCPDLDAAAKAAAGAIFFNQGEVCTAGSRLLLEKSIKDEFIEKLIAAAQTMQAGDPLDEKSFMGAIVDDIQMNRVMQFIETAKAEGANLLLGGNQARQQTGGYFIEPTIFDAVSSDMQLFNEEVFGPVLAVVEFETQEQAIELANQSCYGLAAAVWTRDISKAHKVAQALRAGSVWVNCWDGGDMTMPFGGFKESGNGRDKSLHSLEKYTELKSTWIEL